MGWRISCLSSYNRRRDQRLDAPEAVDPLAEGVLDVIVVLQANSSACFLRVMLTVRAERGL